MKEEYTPQEQEYDEIFMILMMYHDKFPKAIKEIDPSTLESISKNNIKLTIILNLHWQMFSLSDSIVMMNTNTNYRGSCILLRNMMEITLLVQYFDKYPDEARRWHDYQELLINKVFDDNKKPYFEYIHQTFGDFRAQVKEKEYRDTAHITEEHYKSALRFDPIFIRYNVDYKKHFKGVDNFEQVMLSNNYYDILSKDTHLSFTLFEPPERDVEIEMEQLRQALSFTEIVLKIIMADIKAYISEETAAEMMGLQLSMLKVLDKPGYDRLIDDMAEKSSISKEDAQGLKDKGFIELPAHHGQRIVHDPTQLRREELVNEYRSERKNHPERTNYYFDLQKKFIEVSDLILKQILEKADIKKVKSDEEKDLLSIFSAILCNNGLLAYAIIDLNNYKKYSESHAILRYIIESAQMVLYFYQHPYEIYRWDDLQKLCLRRHVEGDDTRRYAKLDYDGFVAHLKEKGYPDDLIKRIDRYNYAAAKWFSPSFIHLQIDYDNVFNHKDIKSEFHQLADIMALHSHPSIAMILYKNERRIDEEIFILGSAYQMFAIMVDVIINRFQQYFPKQQVNDLIKVMKLSKPPNVYGK